MERRSFSSSYGTVSYLYRAGRHPLILLHGLGGSGNNWMRMEPFLDTDLALYMVDMAGHGYSTRDVPEPSIDVQCRILQEFIQGVGIDHFSIMGNSYGGWVALRLALGYVLPEKMVLEDSAGTNPTVAELGREEGERFVRRLVSIDRRNDEETMRKYVFWNATRERKLTCEDLGRIGVPVLVIWGTEDDVIPIDYGRRMASCLPRAQFSEIHGAGHTPHHSSPQVVAALVNHFVLRE
ncbi:hydrolase [Thermogymnomonas acidicola]|uniref:Hydrolase n=1 Tax=Thermogymnomonas acidicola TaxID=399579 RepID=A0AA37F8V9_9ARCH|nr:alpha/beta hydrolase [Thermogymnomonas acidicola]GGM66882.1 hydrolase [Thermogymnomonas acidicola]